VAVTPFGSRAIVVCRPASGPDHADLLPCVRQAATTHVIPLLVDLVTMNAEVTAALNEPVATLGGTALGVVLDGFLERSGPADPWRLRADAIAATRVREALLELFSDVAARITAPLAPPALAPFSVAFTSEGDGTVQRAGVSVSAPPGQALTLVDTGVVAIALEADASWFPLDPKPAAPGLAIILVVHDGDGFRFEPELRIEGLGVRVSSPSSDKLFDLGASVRSVAVHTALHRRGTGTGSVQHIGAHFKLDDLGVPLGAATGDNPVAAKIVSGGADPQQPGDQSSLTPAFSPAVIAWSDGTGASVLVRAGDPPGPWWLPIQRSFGPMYVEQVGVGSVEEGDSTTAVMLLVDGGLKMLGLDIGVDDLSVTVPVTTPLQPATWKLGLAGLAVGFERDGLSIAGGLRERRRPTPAGQPALPPDYVGMMQVSFGQYGITAVGGYGEFPDGGGGTYTSMFLFGALSAPIGGPPAFFVTGIGAGGGINRRLVIPTDMAKLPAFPLVAAMDPHSSLAGDPMAALDRLGSDFPPERGAFWFAAGVRFTSFVLVESIAVVSVEVGNGLEVNLLGLSRLDLPTPATPLARLELALRARFSSRDAVLSVQAQLTDNSWIINESCRLTGGFAYVVWFRTGQFVLTLGGYHPEFRKPPEFPSVPRLAFAWQVNDIISIKGTAYFALTASCVMAGAELDASLDAGWVWGRLLGGFDAVARFDPFRYKASAELEVSGGFEIEICIRFVGCATISFDLSISAELEIEGPELRGEARLDLGPASFPVRFGATGDLPSKDPLSWTEFYDKYLVAGDERRRVTEAVVTRGGLAVPAGEQPDDGSAARPWKVLAEFELSTSTRAASTTVNGDRVEGAAGFTLGVGPMQVARVSSEHRVDVLGPDGAAHNSQLLVLPVIGSVPAAVWEVFDGDEPPPEAKVREAAIGARVIAAARARGIAVPLPVDDDDDEDRHRHPLPFIVEQATRTELEPVLSEANQFLAAQPSDTAEIFEEAKRYLSAGRFRPTTLNPLEQRTYTAERNAPPRLAPLTKASSIPSSPPRQSTTARRPSRSQLRTPRSCRRGSTRSSASLRLERSRASSGRRSRSWSSTPLVSSGDGRRRWPRWRRSWRGHRWPHASSERRHGKSPSMGRGRSWPPPCPPARPSEAAWPSADAASTPTRPSPPRSPRQTPSCCSKAWSCGRVTSRSGGSRTPPPMSRTRGADRRLRSRAPNRSGS
jgi:hypothetical protein